MVNKSLIGTFEATAVVFVVVDIVVVVVTLLVVTDHIIFSCDQ